MGKRKKKKAALDMPEAGKRAEHQCATLKEFRELQDVLESQGYNTLWETRREVRMVRPEDGSTARLFEEPLLIYVYG